MASATPINPTLTATDGPTSRKTHVIAMLLLVALVIVVFGRSATFEFLRWDDDVHVWDNALFKPPTLEHLAQFWKAPFDRLYIPVPYMVWGAIARISRVDVPDDQGSQLNPWLFHASNVIVHAATACVLFKLLVRLMSGRQEKPAVWPAFFGAALFAVHPLQVESVAWVTAMRDLLAGFFSVTAIWQYTLAADGRNSARHWSLTVGAFALAMLSKPAAVVVPVMAGAIDLWILHRPPRKVIGPVAIGLLLSLPVLLVTHHAQPTEVHTPGPAYNGLLIAADSVDFYLHKLILPLHFSPAYGRRPEVALAGRWIKVAWLLPVGLLAAGWLGRRRWPAAWVAPILFFLPILPTSGLVPFLFQYYSTVADRYAYLGMLGAGLAFGSLLTRFPARVFFGMAGLMIVVVAFQSWRYVKFWRDHDTLWQHAAQVDPEEFHSQSELAGAALRRARFAEMTGQTKAIHADIEDAKEHFRRALHNNPHHSPARNWLALLELNDGEWPLAVADARGLVTTSREEPLRGAARWLSTFETFATTAEKRGDSEDARLFREEVQRIRAGLGNGHESGDN